MGMKTIFSPCMSTRDENFLADIDHPNRTLGLVNLKLSSVIDELIRYSDVNICDEQYYRRSLVRRSIEEEGVLTD